MEEHYEQVLEYMENTLRVFESRVPPPELKKLRDGIMYRYKDKGVHQALVQKLARVVSGLHAARVLLANGYVQELGALQRMLDEFQEDISFLAFGVVYRDASDLHKRYLKYFYQEEFDENGHPLCTSEDRPSIPRKKIRAYLARIATPALTVSQRVDLSKTISKVYSGFVHGASPHIMEMYGGSPPRFHVSGMLGTPRIEHHANDLWNYFYRGILSFALVAKAFGDESLFDSIRAYRDHFESVSGKKY